MSIDTTWVRPDGLVSLFFLLSTRTRGVDGDGHHNEAKQRDAFFPRQLVDQTAERISMFSLPVIGLCCWVGWLGSREFTAAPAALQLTTL